MTSQGAVTIWMRPEGQERGESHTGGVMSQALKWCLSHLFTFYRSELHAQSMATPNWQIQSSLLPPLPGRRTWTPENYDKVPCLHFPSFHLLPSSSAGKKDHSKKANHTATLCKSQTDVALTWILFSWLSSAYSLNISVWEGAHIHWIVISKCFA